MRTVQTEQKRVRERLLSKGNGGPKVSSRRESVLKVNQR